MSILPILRRILTSTREPSPAWAGTLLVVEICPSPASLHYRPYADALDETSVLAWVIDRLRQVMRGGSPCTAVLASAWEMHNLVAEGRRLCEGQFSLGRFVENVVVVYDEVLGLAPSARAQAAPELDRNATQPRASMGHPK